MISRLKTIDVPGRGLSCFLLKRLIKNVSKANRQKVFEPRVSAFFQILSKLKINRKE